MALKNIKISRILESRDKTDRFIFGAFLFSLLGVSLYLGMRFVLVGTEAVRLYYSPLYTSYCLAVMKLFSLASLLALTAGLILKKARTEPGLIVYTCLTIAYIFLIEMMRTSGATVGNPLLFMPINILAVLVMGSYIGRFVIPYSLAL